MKLLKNRIFLSALCLILASAVSFLLLPRFYADKSATVTVLRAAQDIPAGTELTENQLVSVEVGSYGLPEGVINDKAQLIGKVAQTAIAKGDYLFPQKVGDYLADALLDRIVKNNQRLVTVSVPSIAAGLSSHLLAGDIVTVAVFLESTADGQDSSPQVILYPELKSLEVYSVENAKTQDTAEMREQLKESQSGSSDPVVKAVTLIVTEAQAKKLIEAEYTGKLHLIFEKRGVSIHEQ
ncbi:flagellar basal body P-ring biosynthesis protein FlgA [Pelotomaculum schinkii]|uniref:Flagellar basal body P-ring biosynthesis protein FlgA n=1 Tax=Pelotomaculum schinkii TaxID=78350 RepID=A0A4Y7RA00_9FIRM|nr:Flp pilus assembly protein CpaB [Pelotomaculum schinkii]TEB05627.1 flagellar basal body P-ring biosynthesis protein FlgA [Pelotomaculum schinkii]